MSGDLPILIDLIALAEAIVLDRPLPDDPEQIEHRLSRMIEKLQPAGNDPAAHLLAQVLRLTVAFRLGDNPEVAMRYAAAAGALLPMVAKAKQDRVERRVSHG